MTVCRCGHDADLHEHWRPGTECGVCPCPAYQHDDEAPAPSTLLRSTVYGGGTALALAALLTAGGVFGDEAAALVTALIVGVVVVLLIWPEPPR